MTWQGEPGSECYGAHHPNGEAIGNKHVPNPPCYICEGPQPCFAHGLNCYKCGEECSEPHPCPRCLVVRLEKGLAEKADHNTALLHALSERGHGELVAERNALRARVAELEQQLAESGSLEQVSAEELGEA